MASLVFMDPYSARGTVARWLRSLSGKSGAYIIREKGLLLTPILYVGESHTRNLYKTVLRHFQHWTGEQAGTTYPKTKVEIAVHICPSDRAIDLQNHYIRELDPRDNILGKEPEPF